MGSKWEPRKEQIRELFIDKKMKLNDVMDLMKDNGFVASKTEYERQLKRWNFRKNLKHEEKKILKTKLATRARPQEKLDVYVGGNQMPESDIMTKISRCHVPTSEQYDGTLQRRPTPEGIIIIPHASKRYLSFVRTKDLPWIYFVKHINSFGKIGKLIQMPVGMRASLVPTLSLRPSYLVQWQQPSIIRDIFHDLIAVLPAEYDIEKLLREITGYDPSRATAEFLKLAIYILSNKLLSFKSDTYSRLNDELLKWFNLGDNVRFLKAILWDRSPTIDAFAEGIFGSAIHAEDQLMSRVLLQSGLNPNIMIDTSGRLLSGERRGIYTPIRLMVQRSNIKLIQLLFEFDAEINSCENSSLLPLQMAAQIGDVEIGRLLICRGAKINMVVNEGASALQISARAGNTEFAKMLLEAGANVNFVADHAHYDGTDYGCPLECAIQGGTNIVAEMLLERGAHFNARDRPLSSFTNTPLQSAVAMGNEIMTLRLLKLGADVNALPRFWKGRTALQEAAEHGDMQLSQTLIHAGANVNAGPAEYYGVTALIGAVSSQNCRLVKLLIDAGADVNAATTTTPPTTALEYATSIGNLEIMQILLRVGRADAGRDDSIVFAIRTERAELVTTLLEAGANIKHNGIIAAAVKTGDCELVRGLLARGAPPGPRSLPDAAQSGSDEMCRLLVEAGADLNAAEDGQYNALKAAALKGDLALMQYLLHKGADVNDRGGVLQAAVRSGDADIVRLLIDDHGADVNIVSYGSYGISTPLQAAVSSNNIALIYLLLDAGANINVPASNGSESTALQIAAQNGAENLIELLLYRGADVNAPAGSDHGCTALQAASQNGHYHAVKLLLLKEADANAPAGVHYGTTALQAAASGGYLRIATLLLDGGADVNGHTLHPLCDYCRGQAAKGCFDCSRSPLICAANEGRIDMLKMLLNAGAIISGDGRWQLELALRHAREHGHDAAARFLESHQIC